MVNPEAFFDTLYISLRLQKKMDDFSLSEIQFFAYFSCLLSLYEGKTIEQWNYVFIKSKLGSPYSSAIHSALNNLVANRCFTESGESGDYYKVNNKGIETLKSYKRLKVFSKRIIYLQSACDTISIIPFGLFKEAIIYEPVLNSANNSSSKRTLLEADYPATKSLRHQFTLLKTALEEQHKDLIIPAVTWLEYLSSLSQTQYTND